MVKSHEWSFSSVRAISAIQWYPNVGILGGGDILLQPLGGFVVMT